MASTLSDSLRSQLEEAWRDHYRILEHITLCEDHYLEALFEEGILGGHGECQGELACPTCVRKWEELKATAAHRS